jgi:NADH:ubiquinone oxidoreductase subunit K
MLMDGEIANAGRHPELLETVAKHGDGAVNFLWQHRGTIAGGAALTEFLASPEPFLNGARDIAAVAGESVVKPVVGGVFTLLNIALGVLAVVVLAAAVLAYKHPPNLESVKSLVSLFRK